MRSFVQGEASAILAEIEALPPGPVVGVDHLTIENATAWHAERLTERMWPSLAYLSIHGDVDDGVFRWLVTGCFPSVVFVGVIGDFSPFGIVQLARHRGMLPKLRTLSVLHNDAFLGEPGEVFYDWNGAVVGGGGTGVHASALPAMAYAEARQLSVR